MLNFNFNDRYVCVPLHAVSNLTLAELKLFIVMINQWSSMADETGWYFRSVRDLCSDADLSYATVCKCLKSLVEKKYLSVKDNKRSEYANFYQLHERLWQPVSKPYSELDCGADIVTEGYFNPVKYQLLS